MGKEMNLLWLTGNISPQLQTLEPVEKIFYKVESSN